MRDISQIILKNIKEPTIDCTNIPVMLTDETMLERYDKVIEKMKSENYDTLVIYADLEHGSNFEYLVGFVPRFEEALLVVHSDRKNYMIMGNENINKVSKARIAAKPILSSYFSLPNQPMEIDIPFKEILVRANITEGSKVGLVGWKNFTSKSEDNSKLYDIPSYIVDAVKDIIKDENLIDNATRLFIGNKGVRCINTVNEIEHYEFGASLAGDCMLKAMNTIELGIKETTIGEKLNALGQKNSVITIAAAGPRFIDANIYPTDKEIELADTISLTVGYKGGLSSRGGYAVRNEEELPDKVRDYVDVVVKPYYNTVVNWLENIYCGMRGGEVYDMVERILPKDKYHWSLCPGHLTSDEEWMSSPIYKNSNEILESGMIFQIDIIPSMSGYGGTSAESTVVLADVELREKIKQDAPRLYERMLKRREYLVNELNINLSEDILLMASTVAYLRPLLLAKDKAMAVKK